VYLLQLSRSALMCDTPIFVKNVAKAGYFYYHWYEAVVQIDLSAATNL